MQLGICVSMFQSEADPTGLGVLDIVKQAGFDYAELPAAQLLALPPEDLDRAVDQILASGLPVPAFNNLFQVSVRLTGPDADDAVTDDYIGRVLGLARKLGTDTFVFGSGGARNVPMGFPYAAAWDQLAAMLRRFGPRAEEAGATVVIEHMNRLEGNIGTSFNECVRLMEEVNLPSVRCLADSFHIALGNEGLAGPESHFSSIRHAHFSNVLGRTLAVESLHEEEGLEFLGLFRRMGYSGRLSAEGRSANPARDIPAAAAFLRKHTG